MNLQIVKDYIYKNNVFETIDDQSGTINVMSENLHDFEYGSSAFFEEGGKVPEIETKMTTEPWDIAPFTLIGKNEDEIAKAYLGAFYSWLLKNQVVNQKKKLQASSINSAQDLEIFFQGLQSQYTSEVCVLTTSVEFSSILNILYGSQSLGILFQAGKRYFNRDLLSWGEPLISLPGPKKGKMIFSSRSSIILNCPQTLTATGHNRYSTELQYKVVGPSQILTYEV